jgi:replicative DNA helicase
MITDLFNFEAEQVILGTLLYDKDALEMAYAVRPEDFAFQENRQIFEHLLADIDAGRSPTTTVIAPLLQGMRVGAGTGSEYLLSLARSKNRQALASCLHAVKTMAARRRLIGTAQVLLTQAREQEVEPGQLALDAMYHLNEAMATVLVRRSEAELVEPAAVKLVESLDGTDDDSMISTGLDGLDKFLGGFARGELTIVAGRPSMGKSALLVSLARRAARKGVNIIFFSLEMQKRAVVARMLSDAVYSFVEAERIPYRNIILRDVSLEQKHRLAGVLGDFKGYTIKVDDQPGLTMAEIQVRSLNFSEELRKQGKTLDLVIVDHIGKIKASDRYAGNVVHETAEKSDALMAMAKNMHVGVVAAHQLNRGPEQREEKRPLMSDLRDTGNLEQDAHTIIFPYRAAYYLERMKYDDPEMELSRTVDLDAVRNQLELIIAKSRNGETGNLIVFVDMANNVVADLRAEPSNVART